VVGDRAGAVAAGLLLDGFLGEPPPPLHPVARFGSGMERLERHLWAGRTERGAAYLAAGVSAAAAVGLVTEAVLGEQIALTAAVAVCSAQRALLDAARVVGSHLDAGDLDAARAALPALVGREPWTLDEKEIARAVVESLAENLSDAVVGTAVWGLLAGAPGALVHRAVNTLDAMVGHRTARHRRFGWASARADDLLGWPAARVTAALVALAAPRRAGQVWTACRRDASAHPSPNAGIAEAAMAAALELRLGGINRYDGREELRSSLGGGEPPAPADIERAVELVQRTVGVLELGLVAVWALAGAARWARRGAQ